MEVLLLEHAAACSSPPTADAAAPIDSSSSMLAVSAWCLGLHHELSGLFVSGSQGQLLAGGLQQYLSNCCAVEQRSVVGLLAALQADCGGLFLDASEMPGESLMPAGKSRGLYLSGSQGQLVAGGLQQYLENCCAVEQRGVAGLLAALQADCAGQQGCGGLFLDASEMPGGCLILAGKSRGLHLSGSQGQLVAGGLQQYLLSCCVAEQRSVAGLLAALQAECGGLFLDASDLPGGCLSLRPAAVPFDLCSVAGLLAALSAEFAGQQGCGGLFLDASGMPGGCLSLRAAAVPFELRSVAGLQLRCRQTAQGSRGAVGFSWTLQRCQVCGRACVCFCAWVRVVERFRDARCVYMWGCDNDWLHYTVALNTICCLTMSATYSVRCALDRMALCFQLLQLVISLY
jgi:hypothetical protein